MAKTTRSKIQDNSDYSQYYTWPTIKNERCIIWNFPNDIKSAKRKTIKGNFANSNLDTIMLDTKTSKHTKVFCDAIFTSGNVSK